MLLYSIEYGIIQCTVQRLKVGAVRPVQAARFIETERESVGVCRVVAPAIYGYKWAPAEPTTYGRTGTITVYGTAETEPYRTLRNGDRGKNLSRCRAAIPYTSHPPRAQHARGHQGLCLWL